MFERVCRELTSFARGGSLVADFLARKNADIEKAHVIAAVRSEEQAKALSQLGITVLQLDLADEKAVIESLMQHEGTKRSMTRSLRAADLADCFLSWYCCSHCELHRPRPGTSFDHRAG